ncbi:MAG: hypothetical protein N4A41_10070 [Crocinitomicaceae bacterium]|jgi:hypothetical protein|nr:hypothetical protein [Crocinitomicaceae bacterium]
MKLRFLTKAPIHKRFDYIPMYYDERKERLELKKKEYARMKDETLSASDRKDILRRNMQATWVRSKNATAQRKQANFRVLILIALILILGYFLLNGVDEVDNVVKKLW